VLEEILYKQKTNIRDCMFFFTINGIEAVLKDENNRVQDLDDMFFKCQCFSFNDLVIVDGNLFNIQKAVCVVTSNGQYFGLL